MFSVGPPPLSGCLVWGRIYNMRLYENVNLHHPVVPPRPARTDIKFFSSARSGLRVMEHLRIEDDTQLSQQFVQGCATIGQSRKLDSVAIHVPNHRLFAIEIGRASCRERVKIT